MSLKDTLTAALGIGPKAPTAPNIKARLAAAHADVTSRESTLADARAALDAVELERSKLDAEATEAEQAYADAPTEAKAKAVLRAREARDLAGLRCSRPASTVAAAVAALEQARAELAALEAEQAEIEHRARVAELRQKSTPAAFRAAAAPHVAALLEAIERAKSAGAAIEAALASTRAAAAELSQLGERTTPPAAFHPALAVALARIGTGAPVPHSAFDFVARLQQMISRTQDEGGTVGLHELVSASFDSVVDAYRPYAGEEYRVQIVDDLQTIADSATLSDGRDAIQAKRDTAKHRAGVTTYAQRDGRA